MSFHCPACASDRITDFYRADDVPVHSCLLLDDSDAALTFPCGDVQLSYCGNCGLIVNRAFDESRMAYGGGYEESQHHSARFREYAATLIERLFRDYSLDSKSVLEIGCGKGEFLEMFASTAVGGCLGIDPACDPNRVSASGSGKLGYVSQLFDEQTTNLAADFVVCRHTLEHILDVRKFVSLVMQMVARRPGSKVFFEVPDTTRILKEGAFWDIYYEHCSYFTPGSLARLFRSCGFRVIDLWREFDDQYLCITACADGQAIEQAHAPEDLEETPDAVGELTRQFSVICDDRFATLRRLLEGAMARGDRVVVWGSGSKCAGMLHTLKVSSQIHAIVDVNPRKQGKYQPGCSQKIVAPSALHEVSPNVVVIMNPVYEQEIRKELRALKLSPQVHCL